jgi:hypothetical protein
VPNFLSTLYENYTNPKTRINYAVFQSIRVIEIPYTIPTGMAANDTVQLFPIAKGETVLASSRLYFPNLGTSTAVHLGDGSDDDKYLASTATTSAGTVLVDTGAIARTPETAEVPLTLKVTGGNPTAGEVIKLVLHLGKTK